MTAIAPLPSRTWAAAHRAVLVVLTMVLLAAMVTLAVVLLTRDTVTGSSVPDLPGTTETCLGGPVRTPC